MNRQQRRQKERAKKKQKKHDEVSPLKYQQIINSLNAVKMASLLVLRNEGWGEKRLRRFSENFNDVLQDVSSGWLSLSDIWTILEEETGLTLEELKVE